MNQELFTNDAVVTSHILYTPSTFARGSLLYLQEIGRLTARRPHVSRRSGLPSLLFFIVQLGQCVVEYGRQRYEWGSSDCAFLDCQKDYAQVSSEKL